MTDIQHRPCIAIFINSDVSDSLLGMKKSLLAVFCDVDFVAVSSLCESEAVESHRIQLLSAACELQQYDLIIYQKGCHFSTIASWLIDYDGKLMVQYDDDHMLSNLRAYHHATAGVRQLELERQHFAEWVQTHCRRVYWLAGSARAADHLMGWGVRGSIDNMAIVPHFMSFEEGKYACERKNRTALTGSILVAGPYMPDTGHIMMIDIIKDYHDSISHDIQLQFVGRSYSELNVYLEEINHHISRSGLEPYIQLKFSDGPIELEALMDADIMLSMDSSIHKYQQCSTEQLHAQAMGLPVVNVVPTENIHAIASSLELAIHDTSIREERVLDGYRNIIRHYTFDRIEQTFLSSVITALGQ
jgi:hypothetical protein